jgi:hypothetical protein
VNDEGVMATRPPTGKWSVVENVRHLVVAEHWHLGRFIPKGHDWSHAAVPPGVSREMSRVRMWGAEGMRVEESLGVWSSMHAATREHVQEETLETRTALWRNRRHLRAHIKVIERLLRANARRAARGPGA